MNENKQPTNFKFFSFISCNFFFVGFALDKISMGAGGFGGDFIFVKESIILFSENSILNSIKLFSETSNRPPLIYTLSYLTPYLQMNWVLEELFLVFL